MSQLAPIFSQSVGTPHDAAPHVIRRRLWKAGIGAAVILAILIGADVRDRLNNPSTKLALGHDFIPSYSAGVVVREGRPRDMYDRQALSAVEFRIMREANLDIDGRYGPWLNPPFYAWVFAPLSMLPYRSAAAVFLIVNLLFFALCLVLLARMLNQRTAAASQSAGAIVEGTAVDWRTIALVPLLVLLPLPFWQVMGHQQNTFISLLLLSASVYCSRADRPFVAGGIAGLLFFKPQHAAVFAAALIVCSGWRALAGLAVTGSFLLLVTLVTMPGCLGDFLHRLPPALHWLQMELPYNWGRQVTFQSFWRLLIQGQVRGDTILLVKVLWSVCAAALFIALAIAAWKFRKGNRDGVARDRLLAASIASMPMLMPYYMDYDLLLLSVPAVLLAVEWIRHPAGITLIDRILFAVWIVFVVYSHFNPAIAGSSRLNPIVPILALIAALHLARCLRDSADPHIRNGRIK